MPRALWTGYLGFGLVSVPVGLYSATRDNSIHFHQFERGTSDRIRYKKVNERTGAEVESADIVRGVDLGGGEYVLVDDEELSAAAPGRSDNLEIIDFVDLKEIDPIYFQRSYYVAPRNSGAARAYALLLEAMRASGRVAIALLVLRDKQYLVAVRPGDGVLVLETMFFADEVRDARAELDELPREVDFSERELETAERLIDSLTTSFDPTRYHDTYRERLAELVEDKRSGHAVVFEQAPPAQSNVVDLMAALQASLERGRATGDEEEEAAAGADDDLESLSRADLLRRAAAAGVAGRSRMSKDELLAALRPAPPGRSRRRRAAS